MQKILPILALFAALAGGLCLADPAPSAEAGRASAPQARLVKVAELKTPQQVQQFLNNVQLVEAQRKAAVDLRTAIQKESDPKKAKQLQSQLDALMKTLNQNNAGMIKTYGFSLMRNYAVVYDSATIYLQLTPDEARKIEQAQARKK